MGLRGVVLCLLALLACAPGAAAARSPVVGVGDQKPDMFSDARFGKLGLSHARRVVPWDALRIRWQRHELDVWMQAARRSGTRPLIAFTHSRRPHLFRHLPSGRSMRSTFRAFRKRYPWVREFTTWNEANHCSQPTCRAPWRVATYYRVMRRVCARCTLVAADVLDDRGMAGWLRRFQGELGFRPRLWGLHNYLDANKFRSSGTRAMLRTVRGRIWFTEVGGIVWRKRTTRNLPDSASRAAAATRHVFRLARISPRIRRVYVYHWNAKRGRNQTWDSGLIGPGGKPRPAYAVFVRELARLRR